MRNHPAGLGLLLCVVVLSALVGCGGSSGTTAPSSNADLISLAVSAGVLAPAFAADVLAYAAGPAGLLGAGSVAVTPTAADAGATITVDGAPVVSGTPSPPIPLPIGATPVSVQVTAEDGTIKTYAVVFNRAAPSAQEAYLKASNTEFVDQFGYAVAISGDTLVVGAQEEDSNATGVNGNQGDNSAIGSGAAYVFVRTGATWTQQAYLKASNAEAGDNFGINVAIDGDTIVVGALNEDSNATGVNGNESDNSAAGSGAAYVFVRSGGSWTQQAYLKASNTEAGDFFGFRTAISGDTVVLTAPSEDSNATGINGDEADNSAGTSGAAYVFQRTGGAWTQQAYLKASNTDASDQYGVSLGLDGDTIVIGANFEDSNATGVNGNEADNSAVDSGAAYAYLRTGGAWAQQAYLKASNTGGLDGFGVSVAISGETIVVGAFAEDSNATGVNGDQTDNSAAGSGAAYLFTRTGGAWAQQAYVKASNTAANDLFATSLAIAGDVLVVAAQGEDSNATGLNGNQADDSANGSGAAYLLTRTGGTWTQQAYMKASNTEAGDAFGGGTFGQGVAASAEAVVVGAYAESSNATGVNGNQADNSAGLSGAAYAFR